jgi:hypothetical protein
MAFFDICFRYIIRESALYFCCCLFVVCQASAYLSDCVQQLFHYQPVTVNRRAKIFVKEKIIACCD